jgi:protein-S-isoprenylcysteine O-methyltransferase Ste14
VNPFSNFNPANVGPKECVELAWTALALVWLVFWFASKRPAHIQSSRERWSHLALLIAGAALLLKSDWPWQVLQVKIFPDAAWIRWTGAAFALLGSAFAIWARLILGTNWSAAVQIKQGHQLIRSGPYKLIRHPIYTGILLILVGDALSIGEVRGVLAFVLIMIGFARKAKKEEALLAGEFGPAFEEHLQRTGFFLPRFS